MGTTTDQAIDIPQPLKRLGWVRKVEQALRSTDLTRASKRMSRCARLLGRLVGGK